MPDPAAANPWAPVPGRPTRTEHALVAALSAVAIGGFAWAHAAGLALLGLVPVALSLAWRPGHVHRWIARIAGGACRVALASVFLMRAGLTLYPVIDDDRVADMALIVGSIVVPLLAMAVLGTRIWRPALAAVPLAIALVVVTSFDPGASVRGLQVAGALLVFAYLAVALPRLEPPAGGRRAWARGAALLAFAAAAGGLAVVLAYVLPWAQPHVEDAAARLLNPTFPVAQAGFSANSRLGDIERLALSRSVVLRVWTPFPRKLRGRVLTEFDGRAWKAPRPGWRDLPPAPLDALPPDLGRWLGALPGSSFGDAGAASRPEAVRTRVAQAIVVADTLFAPAGVAVARVVSPRLRSDRFDVLEAPGDPVGAYALVHAPYSASGKDDGGAETLSVPAETDPRLRALAETLAAGDPPAATKVARTLEYLGRECRYSLEVGAFASRQPVAEFVFDKKRGYCEYFASAAAVLLRLQGVPARYVTGFSMDSAEMVGGHYVVRESDAHAWIEAWIPGRGWVEADPTPAGDYAAVHSRRGSLAERASEWFNARWAEAVLAFHTGELRRLLEALSGPLAALVLAVMAVIGFRLRRHRRVAPSVSPPETWTGDPELQAVVARLDSLWARHGCARPPHRPRLEHLRRLPPGRLPPALASASEDVIACYYDARYGGHPPARDAVRGLARRLEDGPP